MNVFNKYVEHQVEHNYNRYCTTTQLDWSRSMPIVPSSKNRYMFACITLPSYSICPYIQNIGQCANH